MASTAQAPAKAGAFASASYWTLPRKDQIALLVLCRLTEPLAFTSIMPYIYYMIRDFGYDSPSTISALVTLVISVFALGQALTGVLWGRFSDSFGRKPALLLGLLGTATSTVIFGLSRNIYWALAGRLLAGMLNGNVGVLRTMIAEIIGARREHQTRAFAILPITFNIGTVIGPMAGGLLADPAHAYPALFGGSEFLKRFPYLLPNLFPIPLLLLALTCTWLFVEETLESTAAVLPRNTDPGLRMGDALLAKVGRIRTQYRVLPGHGGNDDDDEHSGEDYLDNSEESSDEDDFSDTETVTSHRSSGTVLTNASAAPTAVAPPSFSSKPAETGGSNRSLASVVTKPIRITLTCYAMLMLHCPTYLHLLPLFLATPAMPSPSTGGLHGFLLFNGGMGWSTARIGMLASMLGVTGIALQLGVYPSVANRFGNARVHKLSLLAFPVTYAVTPFLSFLSTSTAATSSTTTANDPAARPRYEVAAMVITTMLGMVVIVGRTFAIPPMSILMTNAVEDRRTLGTVHGLTHSVTSVARCLGPFVLGNLYSLGVRVGVVGLAWWVMAAIVGAEILVARGLKEWGAPEQLAGDEEEEVRG